MQKIYNKLSALFLKPLNISALFFMVGATIILIVFYPIIEGNRKKQHFQIKQVADIKVAEISYELYTRIKKNQATASFIKNYPNLTQDVWESFVTALIENDDGVVSSMSFEENFVIKFIAPFELNKSALGLDLFDLDIPFPRPDRERDILHAVEENITYLEGPYPVVQDYMALVSYTPIFQTDKVTGERVCLGVVDVVLDWEKFLTATGLDQENEHINIAIRGENGTGINGPIFYGDSTLFHKEGVVLIPIKLPMGEWIFAAYPKDGWKTGYSTLFLIFVIVLSGSLFVYFLSKNCLEKIFAERAKLETSESKYRFISENINDLVWMIDINTQKYIYAGGAFLKVTGFSIDEYLNKTMAESMPSHSYKIALELMKTEIDRYLRGDAKDNPEIFFDLEIYHKNGSLIWIEISSRIVLNEKNNSLEIVGQCRLIEGRKKLELELKNSEAKYRLITENMNDMVVGLDLSAENFTFVIGNSLAVFGYTPEEYLQISIKNSMPAEYYEYILELITTEFGRYAKGEIDYLKATFEIQQYHKDGSLVWVEISARAIINDEKEISEIVAISRRIDDRKQLELELKDSEEKYRLMASNMKDTLWVVDINTLKYVFRNDVTDTFEELANKSLPEVFPPESMDFINNMIVTELKKYYSGELESLPEATFELQQYDKDGALVWVEISATALPSRRRDGVLTQIIGTTRRIDDRKKLELELKESEEKYRLLAENMIDSIYLMDLKTEKHLFVSGNDLLDYEEPLSLGEIVSPETYEYVKDLYSRLIEEYNAGKIEEPSATIELQAKKADGSFVWIEDSFKIIKNNSTEFNQVVGVSRSIEDRKKLELELKNSEAKYRLITENMNDMVCGLDLSAANFTFVIGDSFGVFGYTVEEYLKIPVIDTMPLESYKHIIEIITTEFGRFAKGEIDYPQATLEIQQYHKDGSLVWVEISARAIVNEKNELVEIVAITRRIDQRKQLELALKASDENYRVVTENQNDYIWILNLKTYKYDFVAGAYYEMLGYTFEECTNKYLKDIIAPECYEDVFNTTNATVKNYKSGKPPHNQRGETKLRHKKGYTFWIEYSVSFVLNENNELHQLVGSTRNIEDRKALELELKDSEEKYRLMASNMKDTLWIIDINTLTYTFKSDASELQTGYTPEESENKSLSEVFPPESMDFIRNIIGVEFKKYYEGKLEGLPEATFELKQYHKDGSLVWVEISAKALPSTRDDGILTQIIGTTRRIDDRKLAEAKIHEQQKELLAQQTELEKSNATKDRFFAILSHDLRNQFTALINVSSAFNDHYHQMNYEGSLKLIKILSDSTSHLSNLLENLLLWSRSVIGGVDFAVYENNLDTIVETAFKDVFTQAQQKQIELYYNNTSTNTVSCDIFMINTILRNLISNAIKFSNQGTKIGVIVDDYSDENYVLVSVKDEGVGMDTETLNKLFRLDKKVTKIGTNKEVGTGLGLILCKEFIDRHHCKIWVESEIGSGTTFSFTLPKVNRI